MSDDKHPDYETVLATLDAAARARILRELAQEHDAVRERLERLTLASQPRKLAAEFEARLDARSSFRSVLAYREVVSTRLKRCLPQMGSLAIFAMSVSLVVQSTLHFVGRCAAIRRPR